MSGADTFVETRGARLRVRDEGSGSALVFLHGWGFDLDIWQPQAAALGAEYRVVRYDRRGFGSSSGDPSILEDVDDLFALCETLSLGRLGLVAASQSARVALRAALREPNRFRCLIIDGPPDDVNDGARSLTTHELPIGEYRDLAQRGDIDAVRRAWAHHPLTQLCTDDTAARTRLAAIIARYPANDLLRPGAGLPPALGARLGSVALPVLVINGEHDAPLRLASGALLADSLRHAKRWLVPGAGHLPNLDQPNLYNGALAQFFKESLDATN